VPDGRRMRGSLLSMMSATSGKASITASRLESFVRSFDGRSKLKVVLWRSVSLKVVLWRSVSRSCSTLRRALVLCSEKRKPSTS
jgi:hypothetical protein